MTSHVEALIHQLGHEEITRLIKHAEKRLPRFELTPDHARDMVNEAIKAVLKGCGTSDRTCKAKRGRKPKPKDLVNMEAFLHYLRSVINSLIAHEIDEGLNWVGELSDVLIDTTPGPVPGPDDDAIQHDYRDQLFKMLRERAPERLHETIDAWEKIFDHADRVPTVNGNRKHAHEVRVLARECIMEILGLK